MNQGRGSGFELLWQASGTSTVEGGCPIALWVHPTKGIGTHDPETDWHTAT